MEFSLPAELAALLRMYLDRAHSQACNDQPYPFTRNNQEPFHHSQHLSFYWKKLMEAVGCPANLSPHR